MEHITKSKGYGFDPNNESCLTLSRCQPIKLLYLLIIFAIFFFPQPTPSPWLVRMASLFLNIYQFYFDTLIKNILGILILSGNMLQRESFIGGSFCRDVEDEVALE